MARRTSGSRGSGQDGRDPDETGRRTPAKGSASPTDRTLVPHAGAPVDPKAFLDSNLRLALALIDAKEWDMLAARTGIECFAPDPQYLCLFVEVARGGVMKQGSRKFASEKLEVFELRLANALALEFAANPALTTLPVRIELMPGDPSRTAKGTPVSEILEGMAKSGYIRRVRMAIPHGMNLEVSLDAIELPAANAVNPQPLTGQDIVIGIVDDGCAFAHVDFLTIKGAGRKRTYRTRVLTLWDQGQPATPQDKARGWKDVPDFGYGRELPKAAIDAALAGHSTPRCVDEDAVYAELAYQVGDVGEQATHGTRVMGIAAGNGNSLMGWRGVAPRAHIVFVQLPPTLVRQSPKLLSHHIVEGAAFVFKRAKDLKAKAAVVNLSLGGYAGPHDGTSPWEQVLDSLLNLQDRAIVVSAGNGFRADCHAMDALAPNAERTLEWLLRSEDPTGNQVDLWYNGDTVLEVSLTTPDGSQTFGPYAQAGTQPLVDAVSGSPFGLVDYVVGDPANGDNSVMIGLAPTVDVAPTAKIVAAPYGAWRLRLRNVGNTAARFHAWIQRDDLGKDGRRQQSCFVASDADPRSTICDLAGGHLTISVGAFNVATSEVAAYSACGPTRDSAQAPSRGKPEACAPAEEIAIHGGVLSSASRLAPPCRITGTSAAAPHVAGIVALAFEYRRTYQNQHLTAKELRAALRGQAGGVPLVANRREALDARPLHQKDVFNDLVGLGKISCKGTLDKL